MLRLGTIALIVVMWTATSTTALAGKKEDIAALQNQVQALQQQVTALSQNTGQTNADTTVKLSQLQQENQRLTGELEAMQFEMQQLRQRLDTVTRVLAGDNFSGLETSPASAASAPTGAFPAGDSNATPLAGQPGLGTGGAPTDLSSGPQPGSGPVNGAGDANAANSAAAAAQQTATAIGPVELPADPDAAYEYASGFLLSGEYEKARQAFEQYVIDFPNSRHTPDAQFRLGEIYLATGRNADAAQTFIVHIREYPNDPRAPEAYLKLGTSFSRLDQPEQACKIFKQIRTKFPNASPIILQRTDLEMTRNECR